jgi:DNA-binding LacI/PurR family transcriptional regulator
MQQAAKKGWRGNVIRLARGQQDAAVRAIQDGELALLMLEEFQPQSALGLAVRGARGKAIWIGADVTRSGVPSIYVDVSRIFEIVVDYLRKQGHRHIFLLDQKISDNFTERHGLAWQKATAALYSAQEANDHTLHLETPLFQCPSFDAYAAVAQLLSERKPQPTALVGFGEEITQGALAACRTAGYNVPEDISVINILDAPSMVFTYPSMTSVDVNFKKQVHIAMEILDTALSGNPPSADLHVVEPLLIERESVAPRKT